MMRSMFSGVSGLKAHQTKMDVIGNNVANVNTIGFKSGRVTFQEIFSQTLSGASAPDTTTGRGGTNPMQVGLGLDIGTIDTIMTRGSLQRTDNPTDLSIEGEGFFICRGGTSDTYKFTRAGNFTIDLLGNLVTGSGLNVYGWQALNDNGEIDTDRPIEPINIYSDDYRNKRIISAKATSMAKLTGNLDATKALASDPPSDDDKIIVPITVYDKLGNDYKVNIEFYKSEISNTSPPTTTWTWTIVPDGAMGTDAGTASGQLVFDDNGKLVSGGTATVKFIPDAAATGTSDFDVELDFSNITMFATTSKVTPYIVDGYPSGNLVSISIGSDGIITGIYNNGQQQVLGMIAIAYFDNPAGLQKVGDNMFIPTANSGEYKAYKAGTGGVGTLSPGTLEMSNVDLSKEFTEMIITQRGFQANSRIITTSDEMLQELVNLKR